MKLAMFQQIFEGEDCRPYGKLPVSGELEVKWRGSGFTDQLWN